MSNPNNYDFWFQKAMSGVENIQRSLRLNPHHIDSWIYYAGYYASSVDENDKTVEVVNELFKYEPKPGKSPSLFEYVLKKVQNYTDDDAPLKKFRPERSYYMRYCGEWLIAATYYLKTSKISEAWEAFEKAISFPRNKNKAILWYILLVLDLISKKYDKAIENGEKAVEVDPKFKYAWQQLGKAYFCKGDYYHAINCNEKALGLDEFFDLSLKLREEIQTKTEEIKKLGRQNIFSYQRQHLSKEERDFLLDLEKECEKSIPVISEVNWDGVHPSFGFVPKNGHIVELGLTLEAHSIKLIPESIKNLKNLEVLTIRGIYNLQKFPEALIFLKNLKYLRYEHCPLPYNTVLNPNSLPKIICNLRSLEKLHLDLSSITILPDCLAFLPNLNEINIPCPNLKLIPPFIKEYFEYQEFQKPLRRYLIRKKSPSRKDDISPDTIYNQFLLKSKSEAESIKDLINVIEKSELLEIKIKGIKLLKKFPSKNEEEFKFLKRLMISAPNVEHEFKILQRIMTTDPSILIRIAAIEVILYKFTDIAYESIKSVLMNEKALQVNEFIRKAIQNSDSPGIQKIKNEFQDILVIKDIEKLIGQPLRELTDFKVIKKKYYGIQGPHGYIKKGNRITHLGLLMNSPFQQHDLTSLPNNIGDLNHLEELKLTSCQHLTNLPEEIGKLKNLRKLVCTDCKSLNSLPKNIGNLENLEHLKLSKCYSLKRIPPTISKLKKLKVLELKDCWSFISLPENLKGLESLKILNLTNCKSFKNLPKTIAELHNLEEIKLEKCRNLETLPDKIGNIKSLKILNLRSCSHLKKIPKSFGNLVNQKELDLSYCYYLKNLPETIGNLKELKRISLRGCRELKSIPESMSNLTYLEELNFYACRKLASLPKDIENLANLKRLSLSYCDSLSSLPNSIVNLKNLEFVNLEGCFSLNSLPETDKFLDEFREFKKKLSPIRESRTKFHYDRLDLKLKEYQEKRYSELKSAPIILIEKIQNLIRRGVDPEDAKILIRFFRFLEWDLKKSESYKDLDRDQGDMWPLDHYKINENGKVIELHLHHGDQIYLTFIPDYLCSLDSLEIIRFPNNLIETIPECIINLKSLRALELRNVEQPNPAVPDSVKSFIQSLESYNSF